MVAPVESDRSSQTVSSTGCRQPHRTKWTTNVKSAFSRRVGPAAALSAMALTLAACGGASQGAEGDGLSGTIAGSGASSQANAVDSWVAGCMETKPTAT